MQIGISFNPEHWQISEYSIEQKIKMLSYCVEDLGIKHVRVAIRWSDVFIDENNIDLKYYARILDYLLSRPEVRITLNVGPIKTMRWPEETLPSNYFDLAAATVGHSLTESEIGNKALDYLIQLFELLIQKYPNLFDRLEAIQLDNEPFNKFGQFKLSLDREWILKTTQILDKFWPTAKVLFNSNGRRDLRSIVTLVNQAKIDFPKMSWVIGINYYYQVPIQHRIPIIKNMDNLILTVPWDLSIAKLKNYAAKNNIELEVSELQGEPWLSASSPGNSAAGFARALARATKVLSSDAGVIRYWGIEYLLSKRAKNSLNSEQEAILNLLYNRHN